MGKKEVRREEGRCKWLCNEAFYAVRARVPKGIGDRALAFGAGFLAGYGGGCLGKHTVHQWIIEPATGISLEETVRYSLAAVIGASAAPAFIAPEYLRKWAQENKR